VRRAVRIAEENPEMALTRCRKVLELVAREAYERRVGEPAGTRLLENFLQRLLREGHLPARLDAYANAVRILGNVGSHRFGEQITAADVRQALAQLVPILEWYARVEREPAAGGHGPPQPEPTGDGPAARTPAVPRGVRAVVPKGLRSFDANDADFFLDLLPGPRDRAGLPEAVRFWKHGIEEAAEPAFTVAVLYGPSGCGKSSLVKAGLLPRLAGRVLPVYVEATALDTETRLLAGLRRRCPGLPADQDLPSSVAWLRRGEGPGPGRKVLLVLDQFEQWLHGRRAEEDGALARALRQCDGERVQALLLVRDDFWMGLTRFLQAVHVELVQGRKCAAVDLFDAAHARAVLAAFGRAVSRLPDEADRQAEAFLATAVEGLAEDGRVVPVRLALFAEMVKSRPWTPATLREVGGAAGVGAAFLEETFSARTAQPRHRLHQEAARGVLRALLPEQGADLKGQLQSRAKLLEASGYADRPGQFEELLRALDGELRLITPAEATTADAGAERYYQLTHDYLVPAVREWLTRKQKETWRGRAELGLAERAAAWGAKPEGRHLPAACEWLNIRQFTWRGDWTAPQRRMMRQAARHHGLRLLGLGLVLAAALLAGLFVFGRIAEAVSARHAADVVDRLHDAEVSQVPAIVNELGPHRAWADDQLRQSAADPDAPPKRRLHASLALLPVDPGQADYLCERLVQPGAPPAEVLVIRSALEPYREQLSDHLWRLLEDPAAPPTQRFRAACGLALLDPNSLRWDQAGPDVAHWLVGQSADSLGGWLELLRPVSARLLTGLAGVFRQAEPNQRRIPTDVLAVYAERDPDVLADVLLDAGEQEWAVLWPKLEAHHDQAVGLMTRELARPVPTEDQLAARDRLARRQAQAGVALLLLGQAKSVWPLFRHSPNPSRRTYMLHRLRPEGADPQLLIRRLDEEPDVSARRALILALGEFSEEQLPESAQQPLVARLLMSYRDDPDPGIHSAIDWLLRPSKEGDAPRKLDWRQGEALARIDAEKAFRRGAGQVPGLLAARGPLQLLAGLHPAPPERELASPGLDGQRRWYVNGQGQTLAVLPGPKDFRTGSPAHELGRYDDEPLRQRHISRGFAIATRDVTVGQFREFLKAHPEVKHRHTERLSPGGDGPIIGPTWYDAAQYCRWLSEREGVPEGQMFYPPVAEIEKHKADATPLELPPDYSSRTGYRLPTEVEWEYACRAGSVTAWCFGSSEEMLPRYAWYLPNSGDRTWPGGQKKPNDFGLFDVHGNVWQWCQSPGWEDVPEEGGRTVPGEESPEAVFRGGGFENQAALTRCACRNVLRGTVHLANGGFRVARTLP
jgi:formylglycine-generating enzyme required for sulfatase activity